MREIKNLSKIMESLFYSLMDLEDDLEDDFNLLNLEYENSSSDNDPESGSLFGSESGSLFGSESETDSITLKESETDSITLKIKDTLVISNNEDKIISLENIYITHPLEEIITKEKCSKQDLNFAVNLYGFEKVIKYLVENKLFENQIIYLQRKYNIGQGYIQEIFGTKKKSETKKGRSSNVYKNIELVMFRNERELNCKQKKKEKSYVLESDSD